jgi:hypothetical protein
MFVLGPPKDIRELVFFLFGDSRLSEFYMQSFRLRNGNIV